MMGVMAPVTMCQVGSGMALCGAMGGAAAGGIMSTAIGPASQDVMHSKKLVESLREGASAQSGEETLSTPGSGASRSNVLHLAYRPPQAEPVTGITDRRFDGTIRSFSDKEGYGFLRSADFEKAWAAK